MAATSGQGAAEMGLLSLKLFDRVIKTFSIERGPDDWQFGEAVWKFEEGGKLGLGSAELSQGWTGKRPFDKVRSRLE
jgi:hypothetical protein